MPGVKPIEIVSIVPSAHYPDRGAVRVTFRTDDSVDACTATLWWDELLGTYDIDDAEKLGGVALSLQLSYDADCIYNAVIDSANAWRAKMDRHGRVDEGVPRPSKEE